MLIVQYTNRYEDECFLWCLQTGKKYPGSFQCSLIAMFPFAKRVSSLVSKISKILDILHVPERMFPRLY